MSTSRERSRNIAPRLFRRERVADYCDISAPLFHKLVKAGIFPPPRRLTPNFFAWERGDLDRAIDGLPFGGTGAPDTTWDD
jgi:predicted DNA-binding transcriptional regulator AlpA